MSRAKESEADMETLYAELSRRVAMTEDLRRQRDELLSGASALERALKDFETTKKVPVKVEVNGDLARLAGGIYDLMRKDAAQVRAMVGSPSELLNRARELRAAYEVHPEKGKSRAELYEALNCLRSAYRETEIPFYVRLFKGIDRVLRANILLEFAEVNRLLGRERESSAYAIETARYVASGHPIGQRIGEMLFEIGQTKMYRSELPLRAVYMAQAHRAFPSAGYANWLSPDVSDEEKDRAKRELFTRMNKDYGKNWILNA